MENIIFDLEFFKVFNNIFDSQVGIKCINNVLCIYYTRKIDFFDGIIDLSIMPENKQLIDLNSEITNELFIMFKNIDVVTIYDLNIPLKKMNNCLFERYFTFFCSINSYKHLSKVLKNVKKHSEKTTISFTTEFKEYLDILMLGNKKIKNFDNQTIMIEQANFLSKHYKNIVSFNIKYNNKIIAGIICKIKDSCVEMICCNYNSYYLDYFLNDKLYYTVIEWCKCNNVEQINWGNVSDFDDGLKQFKKKFSNIIEEKYLCHCFRNDMFFY